MITTKHCGALAALAAGWMLGVPVQAQFTPPQNSLSFDDSGTLEGVQNDLIKIRDSKSEPWFLKVTPQTSVQVEGEAEVSFLRPGLIVQISGELDEKGSFTKPVEEVEVLNSQGKPTLGLFSPEDADDPEAKPLRSPGPGAYVVRGRLTAIKGEELRMIAGRFPIVGNLGEETKITVNIDDFSMTQFGDTVKVKAWYYDQGKPNSLANKPGQAMAQEVTITLAKPLTGKKPRLSGRALKTKAAKQDE